MRLKQSHVEGFGFRYIDGWLDMFVLGSIQLYNNPFKKGWTIESATPNRQIYSVKALNRLMRKSFKPSPNED